MQRGLVWTTDAPYRETAEQIDRYARIGALAVEMQAASLFAFAAAQKVAVGLVAHVTNAPDHDGDRFEKGRTTCNATLPTRCVAALIVSSNRTRPEERAS